MDFEVAKGDKSINEIASEYGIHPQRVRAWKREFLKKMHFAFEKDRSTVAIQKKLKKVYQKIGQLEGFFIRTVEEVLSKREKVRLLKSRRFPKESSLKRACELLRVRRSTIYYKAKGES